MSENWLQAVGGVVRKWFFDQEFSPIVEEWNKDRIVEAFLTHLRSVVSDPHAFKVEVTPPMWYECLWEDIALDGPSGRWLLHFGFSD